MPRSSNYTYDPSTGKWVKNETNDSSKDSNDKKDNKPSTSNNGNNLTSSNPDANTSTGDVEKQYNTIEINTLSGTLNFIVTKQTIKLRAGDTVKIKGIGKHLSGNYYVQDITRQISSNGYSHSATIIKTDFGKSLKSTTTTTQKQVTPQRTSPSSPTSDNAGRSYTVVKGDCLWNIAKQFYGSGAMYTKIASANSLSNPNLIKVGQVLIIP